MPLSKKSEEILAYILSLSEEDMTAFIKKLSPEQQEYLDIIAEKLQKEEGEFQWRQEPRVNPQES